VQQGRAWYRYGSAVVPAPKPGQLADDVELRPEPLPSTGEWQTAVNRAATLLGITGPNYLTGAAVAELTTEIRGKLNEYAVAARALPARVAEAYGKLVLATEPSVPGRFATASGVATLVAEVLARSDNVALVSTFANAPLPATTEVAAKSLSTAALVDGRLQSFNWARLDPLLAAEAQPDQRGAEAKAALERLRAALTADEFAMPIASALQRAEDDAFAWLRSAVAPPPPPPVVGPTIRPVAPPNGAGKYKLTSRADLAAVQAELSAFLDAHEGQNIVVEWRTEQ